MGWGRYFYQCLSRYVESMGGFVDMFLASVLICEFKGTVRCDGRSSVLFFSLCILTLTFLDHPILLL